MDENTTKLVEQLEKGVASLDTLKNQVTETASKISETEKKLADADERVKGMEAELAKIKSATIITSEKSGKAHDDVILKQFKEMMNNQYSKGFTEGTTTTGGYFVPEELSSFIIDTVERYGFARRLGNVFPMNKDKLNVPSLSGITASVVSEAAQISAETPTVGRITFDSKKIASLLPASNEWFEDVDMRVVNKAIELMAVAIATREDTMAFTANGEAANGSLTGLLYDTAINSVTLGSGDITFASITWDDISDMIDTISTPILANSQLRFFMHRSIRGILRTLADTATYGSPFKASGADVETLWGYPITWLNIMPSTNLSTQSKIPFILFGDPYYLGFGDRRQIAVKTSDQFYFDTDQIGIKATERVDTQCLADGAFCRLITASA